MRNTDRQTQTGRGEYEREPSTQTDRDKLGEKERGREWDSETHRQGDINRDTERKGWEWGQDECTGYLAVHFRHG